MGRNDSPPPSEPGSTWAGLAAVIFLILFGIGDIWAGIHNDDGVYFWLGVADLVFIAVMLLAALFSPEEPPPPPLNKWK